MANITIGPNVFTYPYRRGNAYVYVKKNWADEWELIDDLKFISGSGMPAGRGLGRCEISHRYGFKKEPWWSDFASDFSNRYMGHWIMVRLTGDQNNMSDFWYGRIYDNLMNVYGSDAGESGMQTYTAYEPLQELRMQPITDSVFVDQGQLKEIGWVPTFNQRDDNNMLIGNRTNVRQPNVYHFGGVDLWTRYDILEYLLYYYTDPNGPVWKIDGDTKILKLLGGMKDSIKINEGSTISDSLSTLIPRKLGLDFDIVPYYGENISEIKGFTLHIFSLTSDDISFAGYTLPGNKDILRLELETVEIEDRKFEKALEMKYTSIRVCGERMVVCKSLLGRKKEDDTNRTAYDLEGKWSPGTEGTYQSPGGGSAKNNDDIRKEERFNNVYAAIGALVSWGFPGPILNNEGEVTGTGASYQTTIRETMPILPLMYGYDYTQTPAANSNPDNYTPDFLRPMAFIYDDQNSKWVAAEKFADSIGILAMDNDWGLYLKTKYNHLLAKNNWPGGAEATSRKPLLDYEKVCMTIAFKTDHRLKISKKLGPKPKIGEKNKDEERILEIQVPGAELWYLDADTILDVQNGSLQTTSVDAVILRNDADRLKPWLAGAQAWYQSSRVRGDITIQAWQPWRYMLGKYLQPYSQGNAVSEWRAPFTSIEWTEDGKTILRLGYA